MMPKSKKNSFVLPSPSDDASISQTTIYQTIDAMFAESIAKLPWFEQYSRETRRTIRYAFFNAVAETLRTVAWRMHTDSEARMWSVWDDLGEEIEAYNKELLSADDMRAAAILGLPS